jgi:hypothetical protein
VVTTPLERVIGKSVKFDELAISDAINGVKDTLSKTPYLSVDTENGETYIIPSNILSNSIIHFEVFWDYDIWCEKL